MSDNNQQQQQPTVVFPLPQSSRTHGQEVRIRELIYVLLKRRLWIMVCVIIGIVFGLCLSVASYVKAQNIRQYSIKSSIALASQDANGFFSKSSRDPDSTDFHLAEDMVDAATYILMSDGMLNKVIEKVDLLGVSARDIYNSLRMEQYKQTQIVLVNLYWEDAAEGVKIVEALNQLAPGLLITTLKLGSVTVINEPTAHFVIGGNLNLTSNLFLGIVLGIAAGSALAVLDLLLHPTLLTLKDVEKKLRLPLLGAIGEYVGDTPIQRELLAKDDGNLVRSEVADSYLAAAYTLKRQLQGQEHPCVLITSSERGEGKTLTTACMASALSQIGLRVLAVDLDFPNPMLAGLFFSEVDPARTINALYQGKTPLRDAVMPVNGTLDVLPALLEREPVPLNSGAMDLIRQLQQEYDIVLLDTPPVGHMADTMILNELTDQSLFVIQYDGENQTVIQEALVRMNSVKIEVIGTVVNRVSSRRRDYRDRMHVGSFPNPFAKAGNKVKAFRLKRKTKKAKKTKKTTK